MANVICKNSCYAVSSPSTERSATSAAHEAGILGLAWIIDFLATDTSPCCSGIYLNVTLTWIIHFMGAVCFPARGATRTAALLPHMGIG